MDNSTKKVITINTTVALPTEKAWEIYTNPKDIQQWNTASEDWHTTSAVNDLKEGGSFSYRMEAKDGSFGFDFGGVYDKIISNKQIDYTIGDGRKVHVLFSGDNNSTHITIHFEAESVNPVDMQRAGWQAILDNYKKYAEAKN